MRILGLVLLVLGVLGIAYGGFSYTKERAGAKIGPVEVQVTEKEHVNVPLWAGILVSAAGLALVLKKP
jgi:hypothetical protein